MRFSLTEFLTKAYTIDLVDVEDQTGPIICQTLKGNSRRQTSLFIFYIYTIHCNNTNNEFFLQYNIPKYNLIPRNLTPLFSY